MQQLNTLEKNKTGFNHKVELTNKKETRISKESPHLKRNRKLLSYLIEEKELTEEEARALLRYRKFHFKSKRDMGAPHQITSQINYFEQSFKGPRHTSSHHMSEEINQQEEKALQQFRQMRRQLLGQHKPMVTFIETLFEYAQNDLDFFKSWAKDEQQACIKGLKLLAQNIIKIS